MAFFLIKKNSRLSSSFNFYWHYTFSFLIARLYNWLKSIVLQIAMVSDSCIRGCHKKA
jgi:hypothetical protein